MGAVQTTGQVKIGASSANVDVSTHIFEGTWQREYTAVARGGSFADGREYDEAGNYRDTLTITYDATGGGASAGGYVDEILFHCLLNNSNLVYFSFMANGTVASQSNPAVVGTATVLSHTLGGKRGDRRERTLVLSCKTGDPATS